MLCGDFHLLLSVCVCAPRRFAAHVIRYVTGRDDFLFFDDFLNALPGDLGGAFDNSGSGEFFCPLAAPGSAFSAAADPEASGGLNASAAFARAGGVLAELVFMGARGLVVDVAVGGGAGVVARFDEAARQVTLWASPAPPVHRGGNVGGGSGFGTSFAANSSGSSAAATGAAAAAAAAAATTGRLFGSWAMGDGFADYATDGWNMVRVVLDAPGRSGGAGDGAGGGSARARVFFNPTIKDVFPGGKVPVPGPGDAPIKAMPPRIDVRFFAASAPSSSSSLHLSSAAPAPLEASATVTASAMTVQAPSGARDGLDMPGRDLPGMPVALTEGAGADACWALCNTTSGCAAWAYGIPGCGGGDAEALCWLKGLAGPTQEDACRVSGDQGLGSTALDYLSLLPPLLFGEDYTPPSSGGTVSGGNGGNSGSSGSSGSGSRNAGKN